MSREALSNSQVEILAYSIRINTSAFQYKQVPLKERTQKELIPKYWRRFKMDQKQITASCEDRLSELTTSQIDRIIAMEKIRSLLYDKKKKVQDMYFQWEEAAPNRHSNVYQANFLAKINQIAIKRNIHHEAYQGFDEYVGQRIDTPEAKERKSTTAPYKYTKHYKIKTSPPKHSKTEYHEEEEVKSIESFEDDLEAFEKRVEATRREGRSAMKSEKSGLGGDKLLPSNRWFYGMSTRYINPPTKTIARPKTREVLKTEYDIEAELRARPAPRRKAYTLLAKNSTRSTNTTFKQSKGEALSKFKINRLVQAK